MLSTITAWMAANTDFVAVVLLTAVGVIICTIVFPQDGSGGDFDFGSGGDGGD